MFNSAENKDDDKKEHLAADKSNTVTSLLDLSISFIARNVKFVDSFCGFPDLIGEKIFRSAIELIDTDTFDDHQCMSLFTEAYGGAVLDRLALSGKHLVLNKQIDLIQQFADLTKLDISDCGLGDDHEMLHHISKLQCLQTLNLRGNALSDEGLRKLAIPVKMFYQEVNMLQNLDLSDNKLTDSGLKHLLCFHKLEMVNLSANKIKDYRFLKNKGFALSSTCQNVCEDIFTFSTHGWALPLVSRWCKQQLNATSTKVVRRNTFYTRTKVVNHPSISPPKADYTHVLIAHHSQYYTANSFPYPDTHSKYTPPMANLKHTSNNKRKLNGDDISDHLKQPKKRKLLASGIPKCGNKVEKDNKDNCDMDEDLMMMYGAPIQSKSKTHSLSSLLA